MPLDLLSALTLLVARVLANDVNLAVATNDLALVAHLLDRRAYLHDVIPFGSADTNLCTRPAAGVISRLSAAGLLVAVGDAAAREVVGRDLHDDLVAREDSDVVHPDLSRDGAENGLTVLELHVEHSVRQGLDDPALEFDCVLLAQVNPSLRRDSD